MSEQTRYYEIKLHVAVDSITEGQYRVLCEATGDTAESLLSGVDFFLSGRIVEDPA